MRTSLMLTLLTAALGLYATGCGNENATPGQRKERSQAWREDTQTFTDFARQNGLRAKVFAHARSNGVHVRTETGVTAGEFDVFMMAEAEPNAAQVLQHALGDAAGAGETKSASGDSPPAE